MFFDKFLAAVKDEIEKTKEYQKKEWEEVDETIEEQG